MGNATRPRIDKEDTKMMACIVKYGFLDMCFLLKFYRVGCKQRTIEGRILQLAKHKYLEVEKMFVPHDYVLTSRTGYSALTLGKVGIDFMERLGYEVTDYRNTLKNSASYRVYHQVQVATVCESIKLQFENSDSKFRVRNILSERESCLPNRANQPDAMLLFERIDGHPGVVAIFLELERSYASKDRIHSKLSSYNTVIHGRYYSEYLKLPIVGQRVLFVSQTDKQLGTILAKVELSPFAKEIEILVVQYSKICEQALTTVYTQPVSGLKYMLLSNMNPTKE